MTQKTWKTPRLTVIVRSNPEEAVLLTCKRGGVQGPNWPEQVQGNACAAGGDPTCEANRGT